MKETWKDLIYQNKDYGDRLEISNTGKIRNKNTGTIYKLTIGKTGYLGVCISLGSASNKKMFKLHKALAETFMPHKDKNLIINHIDGDKLNNNLDNLEWCTYKENSRHAVNTKLYVPFVGCDNSKSKFTEEQIIFIRNNYIPKHQEFGIRAFARKFNVHHSLIENIIHKKSYFNI